MAMSFRSTLCTVLALAGFGAAASPAAANRAYGVTTTHDPSASTLEVFGQSEMVEAGLTPGPRIFSTGYILYGAEDPNRAKVESLDDARKHLRRMKALGAFTVKSYMQPRREQRQWILQAARGADQRDPAAPR